MLFNSKSLLDYGNFILHLDNWGQIEQVNWVDLGLRWESLNDSFSEYVLTICVMSVVAELEAILAQENSVTIEKS